MNMFNDTTKGRFVFLIDSRACLPSINLSSVDTIIIYGSDLNPLNDLKALRRIKIESQLKFVRIFRLYTPFTVEEKGLVLAKQGMIIDSNCQDILSSLSHCFLSWGASFLFSRVDELQQDNCASKSYYERGMVCMDKVMLEFLAELSKDVEDSCKVNSATISKACMSGEFYSRNITLIGEAEGVSSLDEDPPKFWLNLLDGRSRDQHYKRINVPTGETNEARRKLSKTGDIAGSSSKFSSGVINDNLFPEIGTLPSADLHLPPETGKMI
jgi:chromodomain-helicase-DNA-binding protein 4